jgi:hypothetical protein
MKKFALLVALVFVAGVSQAAQNAPAAPAKPAPKAHAAKAQAGKTHDVTTEVVSVDSVKNTITLKGEKENTTAPVEGKALAQLKTVKAGEKVTVTCRDNDKGEHQAVTNIKPAAPAAVQK